MCPQLKKSARITNAFHYTPPLRKCRVQNVNFLKKTRRYAILKKKHTASQAVKGEKRMMNYRTLGKTGMRVSEVGLGCEHLQGKSPEQVRAVVDAALEAEMNIFDIFMSEPEVRSNIGDALAGRRERVLLQGHIGAAWKDGQYCRTRDEGECRVFFEDFLRRLRTDYVDIGMLHYIDSDEDFDRVFNGPVYAYARKLRDEGVIRAIGMSSHNPIVAVRAAPYIDVLMFSVNPAFDFLEGRTEIDALLDEATFRKTRHGIDRSRMALYEACERAGVGITVMKAFAAGNLLSDKTSPFGRALTPYQCIAYALDRPAAASVLAGAATPEEVRISAGYSDSDAAARDYTEIMRTSAHFSSKEQCMYCNHCLPCPENIDIAAVNRLYDLASVKLTDTLRDHYRVLGAKPSACIGCGSCEANCPFDVPVRDRMARAAALFER